MAAETMQFENDLHDFYVDAVTLQGTTFKLLVRLYDDYKEIRLLNVTRCLINNFLIQNIVHDAKIVPHEDSEAFEEYRRELDQSYPRNGSPRFILCVTPSVGAEMIIEFDDLEIKQLS
jgi:hypothetical protein